jgi:hypothetical protein
VGCSNLHPKHTRTSGIYLRHLFLITEILRTRGPVERQKIPSPQLQTKRSDMASHHS